MFSKLWSSVQSLVTGRPRQQQGGMELRVAGRKWARSGEELQGGIDSIETNVLQASLIVKCLERSIGRDRNLTDSEYDAILSSFSDPDTTQFVKSFTTLDHFTKKEAKAELEKAKAELKEAETKLKEAEKMWTTVEEIVSIVKDEVNHKSFFRLKESGSSRPGLIEEIKEHISKPGKLIGTESQHSVALVLAGSNGVGKTYCSFLIGSGVMDVPSSGPGVRRRVMVSAYCGMNNGWQLCEHEESQINRHRAAGLKSVLYVRLALALQHRAANMDKPWDCLNYRVDKSMTESDALEVIKNALAKMQQYYSDCEMVVFGVVDEVQTICGQNGKLDGPRLVLRFLREVQVALLKSTGVLFVGLTTGTLYKATQPDPTSGWNLFVTKPFCDSFEYLQLDFEGAESLNENEVRMVKLVAYPRARLLQYPLEEWDSMVGRGMLAKDCRNLKLAQKLLPHALLKTTVSMGDYGGAPAWLGHHVRANPDPPQATTGTSTDDAPVVTDDYKRNANSSTEDRYGDMYVPLDDYLLVIECVVSMSSYIPTITTNLLNPDWTNFETCAGQVIMCIIALATSKKSGQAVRVAVISTNPWLTKMFGNANIPILTGCLSKKSSYSKSNMTPFGGGDSLEAAIKGGVRQEVKDWISEMAVDTCLLIHCGGNTPFDYVLFVKVKDPITENISLRAVLIDAKHSEKGSNVVDYSGIDINTKYKKVGEGLKNGLGKEYPDLKVGPPFIVTNKKDRTCNGVEYLSRVNMKLGGVTRFLFDV